MSVNRTGKSKISAMVSHFEHELAISPVIIGREDQLNTLDQALLAAKQGQGRCVLIAGEAGIGKSRLVAELRSHAVAEQFHLWEGHSFEQDLSFPYAPWIDALRAFLAPKSSAETGEMLGSLAAELIKILPELALLIGDLRPNPALDAGSEKHRLFETVARLGVQLAKSHPLLVMLEDLHWSDEPSLELLHYCARRFGAFPILLVGTYRSEEITPQLSHYLAELNRDRLVRELRLGPLGRLQVGQITRAILMKPDHSVNAEWFDLIVSLTEGNPFYVEEILRSFVQTGDLEKVQLPRSIQDSVQRRVKRLPQRAQQVLSLASVIGERFDFGLLQEIAGQDEHSLLEILKELITAQLIVEQSADQFSFHHALTRQAVYATLLLRERKALHQRIGETIERLAGVRTNEPVAQLAYHFYQAEVWHKVLPFSQQAGEQAQALYAPREAVAHFTHALEAARQLGLPLPLSALRGRAHAREVLGDFEGALADDEEVLELARREPNRVDEWQSLIDAGFLLQSRDLKRAGGYYQQALELARDLGDPAMLAHSLNRVGNWHMNSGSTLEAQAFHNEALALFQKLNDRHGIARTMDLLALVNFQLGDIIQGTVYLHQAIPILREVDDRQALVNTLTNLGNLGHFETEVLGDLNYRRLAEFSEEALEIARGFNWSQGEVRALIPGAVNYSQAGDYARALEWLSRANAIMKATPHREAFARLQITSGQILIGLLALPQARERLESGLVLAQELGAGFLKLSAIARLATVAVLQNDLARAKQLLDPWLSGENPQGRLTFYLRRLWSGRAELELAGGNSSRSLEIVDQLFASTVNLAQHGPYAVPYLSRLRAQALAALGHLDDAAAELQGTLAVAYRQEQRFMFWRLHADLGNVYRAMGRHNDAEREFSSARAIIQDLAITIPEGALRTNFLKQALMALPAEPTLTPRQNARKEFGGLTAREREIAGLVAQGKSNREIAETLFISETTAERHVANILSKLGFNSRTQIAVWVVEKGLGR